jgi:small subunit ribosomal protein S13
MIYLFESELPKNKSLSFALCSIYGLGRTHAFSICKTLGFSKNLTVQALSKEQVSKLIKYIESLDILIAGDLLKARLLVAKKLISIKSYRGLRRYQGLPIRGQRTHTNARTSRKKLK